MYEDYFCEDCGDEIESEFINTHYPLLGYVGHCSCVRETEKERASREKYDFSQGARDKRYRQPTLGDLLRSQLKEK